MKILVVSNLYPPHHIGGYELGCRDVVEGLRARRHEVRVLTSTFQTQETAAVEDDVERLFPYESTSGNGARGKLADLRVFREAVARFNPEIIYFWNQQGLTNWLPLAARWNGWKMAFFLSDTSFVSWRVGAWLAGPARKNSVIKAALGKTFLVRGWPVMHNCPCHFASEFLRDAATRNGIPVAEKGSAVIHWGIDPSQFHAPATLRWPLRRLLYVGQMIPQKGVHTAISAFGLLAKEKEFAECTFTLAGSGQHPEYEKQLREMPAQLGISDRVHFLGRVPRGELPAIYGSHDILVFPSEWDEPFAITPLEAMASGLIVVGTTTGGSGELFRNRETAMTFAAGDSADCARAIRELCADQKLAETIRECGKSEVIARHSLTSMMDQIEGSLQKLVK